MKQVGLTLIFLTVFSLAQAQNLKYTDFQDPLLEKMSVEQKLGKLFLFKACNIESREQVADFMKLVKNIQPGGIYFEEGLNENYSNDLQQIIDREKSNFLVISSLSNTYFEALSAETLHAIADQSLLQQLGKVAGRQLLNAGSSLVMDPAFSVSSNQYRYYGKSISEGVRNAGAVPVFKDVESDFLNVKVAFAEGSDPVIERKSAFYEKLESFDLRNQGFSGLVIVPSNYPSSILSEPEKVYHQLMAGADMVYDPLSPGEIIEFLTKKMKSGDFSERLLDQKVSRILSLSYKDQSSPASRVIASELPELKKSMLRSSVSLNKNPDNLIPFRMLDTLKMAYVKGRNSGENLEKYFKKYGSLTTFKSEKANAESLSEFNLVVFPVSGETNKSELALLQRIQHRTKVLVILSGDVPLLNLGNIDYLVTAPEMTAEVERYIPQLIYGAYPFEGSFPYTILPNGFSRSIKTEPLGRLAYTDPSEAGMCETRLKDIHEIAMEAMDKGATPGMQILVARKGKVVYEQSFGYFTYDQGQPVSNETIYDLASVTKVASTLQAVTFMVENGLVGLNDKIGDHLPELKGSNKENMIVKDLLLHQAGLRPWLPFWQQSMSDEKPNPELYSTEPEEEFPLQVSRGLYANEALKDSVWQWIIDSRLLKTKYGRPFGYRYSDMGFYIMQQLAERVLNQPLNDFVDQNFYGPMGMTTTGYLPLSKFEIDNIAPTAEDPYFRKQLIKGIVHDEGAAMFGGVAGHSGLFSNANDLVKLFQMYLQNGYYGGHQYFRPETVEIFTKKQVKDNRRGLGWDKPDFSGGGTIAEAGVSSKTYGHTGFTGTAVWVDPEYDLIYVFLSNRIHPDAENGKLMSLNIRSRIQEIVYESMEDPNQLIEKENTQ